MPTTGTFVLGLGCQKGGTTWLGRYLGSSPQFESGFKKEYHVFDHPDIGTRFRRMAIPQAREALDRLEMDEPVDSAPLQWVSFYADHEAYYDYFSGLLTRPGVRATGDITPLYALLPTERLVEIKETFAERGIRTVAVFLMRDPLERVWSLARMRERDGASGGNTAEELVRTRYRRKEYVARTRYDLTLARIDEVFDPEDVFVEFYERLFDDAPLRRLTAQLGMDFHSPDFERRANKTEKKGTLDPTTARAVANHFRPVYADVAARFPDVDLAELWPSARLLDDPVTAGAAR